MRLLLYVLLNIVLLPVYAIGMVSFLAPLARTRGRVSGTTYEPFNGRLVYHLLGSRPDAAALQLARGLPTTNRGSMWCLLRPLAWTSRVTGCVPAFARYPPPRPTMTSGMVGARCERFDSALRDHVSDGDQVVVLGAGWDTRAYGLLPGRVVTWFEVDTPATQAVKRRAIETTGLDASHVTFVACDLNRQPWLDALEQHGFDRTRRTFVLWEGVTMYLHEQAITDTLQTVATLPAGSRIAFDFFSRELLESVTGLLARLAVRATYGERFTYGFPTTPTLATALGARLAAHGLELEASWPIGDTRRGGAVIGGLVVAVRR